MSAKTILKRQCDQYAERFVADFRRFQLVLEIA